MYDLASSGSRSYEERLERAIDRFIAHFGPGPVLAFRTPGRINLIGEHTDYNGGFVLPVALDRDILLIVRPRDDRQVNAINQEPEFPPFSFTLSKDIPPAPRGDWSNYLRGAGQEICRRFGESVRRGIDVLVAGAAPHGVPRGVGVSSSTALTVSTALALVKVNEIEIARPALAQLCSEAEWYVGTRGGMMDQFCTLLGRRGHALFLDCRPSQTGEYTLDHVPIPDSVRIALLNSGIRHNNARGHFNRRVAECKIGVQMLRRHFPHITHLRDVAAEALGMSEARLWELIEATLPRQVTHAELFDLEIDHRWLREMLTDHRLNGEVPFAVLSRCRHVITENQRVLAGVEALRAGDVERFGELMNAAHASMRDNYEASCPEVDALVEMARRRPGVLGARITGSGWGGGVVVLVRADAGTAWIDAVRAEYERKTGLRCEGFICSPGDGASQVIYA